MVTEAPTTEVETEELLVFEDEAEVDACQSCAKIFRLRLLLPLLLVDVEVEVDAVVITVATLLVSSSLLPLRARILLSLVVLLVVLLPLRRRHRSFFFSCCCSEAYAEIPSAVALLPLLLFVNIAIVGIFVSVLVRRWDVVVPYKIGRTIVTTM